MTAGRAGALRDAARYAQALLTVAAGVGFAWSGIDTLTGAGDDVARTVLGAVLLAAALLCAAALYPLVTGRPSTAGWGFVTAALAAALAADVVFLDVARTPRAQPGVDAVLAAIALVETALAVSFLHLLLNRGRAALLSAAALVLAAVLVGFVAWTGYVAAPQRARPALRITTALTGAHRVDDAAGRLDHVTLTGTVRVHNSGARTAVVAGSLLDVVGHTSAPASTPISAGVAAGFETEIADALDEAHALEPIGANRHALSGFWPTSDQSQALLELDEVLPGATRLAPGADYTRRFTADIPALVENPLTSVSLDAEVLAVDGAPGGIGVDACSGQLPAADGHLGLRRNTRQGGGYVACVATKLDDPTPYGALIDDRPGLQVSFVLGDTAVPGAETGRLVATLTHSRRPVANGASAATERYLPLATAEGSTEVEVSARADAGP